MSLQRAFAIGASGLVAQRTRMETVASNLVNVNTTRTAEGGPYQRLVPIFVAQPTGTSFADRMGQALRGVRVEQVSVDPRTPVLRFEPGHPDADPDGMVAYPGINAMEEMVDLLSATRSYEANVTLIQNVRNMKRATLEIIG